MKKRKLIALIMCLAMAMMTFAGCGGSDADKASSDAGSASTSAAGDAAGYPVKVKNYDRDVVVEKMPEKPDKFCHESAVDMHEFGFTHTVYCPAAFIISPEPRLNRIAAVNSLSAVKVIAAA